jgi:hypothetical protein
MSDSDYEEEPIMVRCPHCHLAVEVNDCDCLGAGDSSDLYCPNCNGTIADQFEWQGTMPLFAGFGYWAEKHNT